MATHINAGKAQNSVSVSSNEAAKLKLFSRIVIHLHNKLLNQH